MITMILDGYNVIHAAPELAQQLDRSLEAARDALVSFCQAYRTRRGDVGRFYVVFDGNRDDARGPQGDDKHVTVVFTRREEEADERILHLIEAQNGRSRCVVVSNDNEVCNNARAFGAQVMSVQTFYEKAQPATTRRRPPAAGLSKELLSTSTAQHITEEYRKHLENKAQHAPRHRG